MRNLISLLLLALLTAAPLALAQDEPKNETNETRPDDAAWVEDCPPDMMCAYGGEEEPSRGPEDGSCENCRGEDQPVLYYGNESCIECSGPAPSQGTCMDGEDANETCRDDVQYFGGDGAPHEAEPISAPVEDAPEQNAVPAPAVALAILALAAAIVIVGRR